VSGFLVLEKLREFGWKRLNVPFASK